MPRVMIPTQVKHAGSEACRHEDACFQGEHFRIQEIDPGMLCVMIHAQAKHAVVEML